MLPPINPLYHDNQPQWIQPRSGNNHPMQQNGSGRSSSRLPPVQKKKKHVYIPHQLHEGFLSGEEIMLENALQIVSQRLFKPEILENMYQVCNKHGYFLESGVWERSQLQSHVGHHSPHDLLEYQLTCLRIKGENDQFPMVHIYPFYASTATSGSGTIGCVSCISHRSRFTIEGEFQMKINQYHLNATNPDARDPVRWAGVIVHELLHNLGHRHEFGDYSDAWQINAFEHCFMHNGRYFVK